MLNDRLRRSGLPDALFFVVNVDPSFPGAVDDAEDEIEKEAWLGVSPDEIESFSDIDKTADSLELSVTPDIRLIQDNENLGIWKNLRGSRDQVLVIDRYVLLSCYLQYFSLSSSSIAGPITTTISSDVIEFVFSSLLF